MLEFGHAFQNDLDMRELAAPALTEPHVTHRVISTILRHDAKQTSYKIALLRALNDAVLAYPDLRFDGRDVAVPLRVLAESWVAYYWPFVAPGAAIDQGVRSRLGERERHDLSFRPHLTELRRQWEGIYGPSDAAGGWHLVEHLRAPRHRDGYPAAFLKTYAATLRQMRTALAQPIQYAGPAAGASLRSRLRWARSRASLPCRAPARCGWRGSGCVRSR